jgi:hypothetical protein
MDTWKTANVSKKSIFQKYILTSGFKDAMIRAIVALYEDPDKPDDPVAWLSGFLGYGIPTPEMIESHQREAEALTAEVDNYYYYYY